MRRLRLPAVDRALGEPLWGADLAAQVVEGAAPAGAPMILRFALGRIGSVLSGEGEPLSEPERERLRRWAHEALVHEEAQDGAVPKPEGGEDAIAMLDLAARVDVTEQIRGAIALLKSPGSDDVAYGTEGDDVHDLRKDPPRRTCSSRSTGRRRRR